MQAKQVCSGLIWLYECMLVGLIWVSGNEPRRMLAADRPPNASALATDRGLLSSDRRSMGSMNRTWPLRYQANIASVVQLSSVHRLEFVLSFRFTDNCVLDMAVFDNN